MKKILDEKCLFIFLLQYLFILILCAKILYVTWAYVHTDVKNFTFKTFFPSKHCLRKKYNRSLRGVEKLVRTEKVRKFETLLLNFCLISMQDSS